VKTLILSVILALISLSAAAEDICGSYFDTRAYEDDTYTFCWATGAICYNCVNTATGGSCASDWTPCDPNRYYDPFIRTACAAPQRAVTPRLPAKITRVARLNAGHLL
jgi:hypothetical protein